LTPATSTFDDENEDLDKVWKQFDVQEPKKLVQRHMFLGSDNESMTTLQEFLRQRIVEGNGETVYHVGFEDTKSMKFTLDDWNRAYGRLVEAAKEVGASCELLCTKNVGGPLEIQGKPDDKDCHGKILIRRIPQEADENIETRIVVVGNGKNPLQSQQN
jgi:GTPase